MAIVCDLALCIGREVTLDALLTKVLQRFMYHCGTPVGMVLEHDEAGYRLLKVIGDDALNRQCGSSLPLPSWLDEGDECILPHPLPLPGRRVYHHVYRLKVEGGYLILLLSLQQEPAHAICQLFNPVLATWRAPSSFARTANSSPCASRPSCRIFSTSINPCSRRSPFRSSIRMSRGTFLAATRPSAS